MAFVCQCTFKKPFIYSFWPTVEDFLSIMGKTFETLQVSSRLQKTYESIRNLLTISSPKQFAKHFYALCSDYDVVEVNYFQGSLIAI